MKNKLQTKKLWELILNFFESLSLKNKNTYIKIKKSKTTDNNIAEKKSIITTETKENKKMDIPEAQKALLWARNQMSSYIQPCDTKGCKRNQNDMGNISCKTPTYPADDQDKKKNNHEDGHAIWHFYCMRFVRMAYGAPGGYPSAKNMHDVLNKIGKISKEDIIPTGSLVFWYWSTYGHVGIYSDEGKVIHTGVNRKRVGVRESLLEDITDVMNSYNKNKTRETTYLGWAYPPGHWLK